MTQQRQSFGPGRVLAQVTLIVALPLVGGVIAGLVVDGNLGDRALFVLSGLAVGTLVTALWLRRVHHDQHGPTAQRGCRGWTRSGAT